MAFESAFQNLGLAARQLHEVTRDLTIALSEDQPTEGAPAAQHWADNAENLHGLVRECLEAASCTARNLGPAPDLYHLRRHLSACQKSFNGAVASWFRELAQFDQMEELSALGRRPKREWQAWTKGVRIALECCHDPLEKTAAALLVCWQELCERAGGVSVTVNSAGIGRQVNGARPVEAVEN